ncbi:unknown function [Klebsiella phage vB_Kpl_K59PH2]|uniref:Uncharacterized protein n=1 Tax=Klebsiella phage vB_Kpl_K59PH2 TaxID=3071671 RepID=A0AAD2JTF3_9CAUD|nr:unknown function [Klebsiella phage vB_Kpl_K59PH2]
MSNIYIGLHVRALDSCGILRENIGKVATVFRIAEGSIHYRYLHNGLECTVHPDKFWLRFEVVNDDKPTGVAATAGHCSGNGGLRGHSVGDVFPVVVYQRGTPGFITHWLRLPDGRDIGPYHSYDDVHRAAAWHKDNLRG